MTLKAPKEWMTRCTALKNTRARAPTWMRTMRFLLRAFPEMEMRRGLRRSTWQTAGLSLTLTLMRTSHKLKRYIREECITIQDNQPLNQETNTSPLHPTLWRVHPNLPLSKSTPPNKPPRAPPPLTKPKAPSSEPRPKLQLSQKEPTSSDRMPHNQHKKKRIHTRWNRVYRVNKATHHRHIPKVNW